MFKVPASIAFGSSNYMEVKFFQNRILAAFVDAWYTAPTLDELKKLEEDSIAVYDRIQNKRVIGRIFIHTNDERELLITETNHRYHHTQPTYMHTTVYDV